LQFILPIDDDDDDILLNFSDASPSESRKPFAGSISIALAGSVSTSNLLRASYTSAKRNVNLNTNNQKKNITV